MEDKAYKTYMYMYQMLVSICRNGGGESQEAESIRDRMDDVWNKLNAQEKMSIGRWAEEFNLYPWQKTNDMSGR